MGQFFATGILLFHPDYTIQAWVPYVIFIVILLFSLAVCACGTLVLERWNKVGGIYVLLATLVLFITPLVRLTLCRSTFDTHSLCFIGESHISPEHSVRPALFKSCTLFH